MSTETFPTFPLRSITLKRKADWATKIQTGASGKELRTSWRSRPRYEFQITIESLVTGRNGLTQPQILMDFYNRMRGAYDTFSFVDPLDGTTRTCRFKDDHLELERFTMFHWKTSGISILEVL